MKKLLLSILVMFIVLAIVLGGTIIWATTQHQRINVNSLTITPLKTQRRSLTNSPKNVNIAVHTAKVIIKRGQVNQLTLNHVTPNQFDVTIKGNQLTLLQNAANNHHVELGKSAIITLTVAEPAAFTDVTIHQFNGTLQLNDLTTQRLAIDHTNGTTNANHLTVTAGGHLRKQNGATTLTHLKTAGLQVSVKTGQFKLNGHKRAGNHQQASLPGTHPLTISSGSGQVQITD
ncbi:hypothetical protein [Levilactobacillus yonginensis]|uniref:hypothetical protein n=1 Tax=Levilactobacillus yonginensis TaxID=1054041 RepID=UPI00345CB2F6